MTIAKLQSLVSQLLNSQSINQGAAMPLDYSGVKDAKESNKFTTKQRENISNVLSPNEKSG